MEWEAVTKGTYQIVITSHAAYSGMDKCGSCVQLHRWSECVLQIEKVLNYFVFEKTNGRKINDDCQRKLSLYFLMDGGWFSARREIVWFFLFLTNKMMPNRIYCYITLFLLKLTALCYSLWCLSILLKAIVTWSFSSAPCTKQIQGWGFFNNCRILPLKYEQS